MKFMNIIKLLTVLLCIGLLFIACDKIEDESKEEVTTEALETETETEAETYTEEPLLENVEPEFDNFFEIVDVSTPTLSGAEKIDGDIWSAEDYGNLVVLKTTDIDTKNIVTETYNIYNTATGELVFTVTDEYFNCEHDSFNFMSGDFIVKEGLKLNDDGSYVSLQQEKTYRESYMTVAANYDNYSDNGYAYVNYFVVAHAEVTPIDEEIREANPDGCVYEISAKYSYYDAYGNLITESNSMLYPQRAGLGSADVVALIFGAELAYFNAETGEFITTSNLASEKVSGLFAYENERYGYYTTMSTSLSVGSVSFMDIVEKQSGEVTRYHFDNEYANNKVYYLHNGDLLIQYSTEVLDESEPYDFYVYDAASENGSFTFYRVKTVIYSVDDGKETVIEKPEFIVSKLMTGEDFAENAYIGEGKEIKVTANARNIAIIRRIKDGVLTDLDEMVVLDNDLKVLYTVERINDQQTFDLSGLGYTVLPNGDRLVTVETGDIRYAIVDSEGNVRSHLTYSQWVEGNYVVDYNCVYDYDLNLICNYAEQGYTVDTLFGECVFITSDNRCMSFTVVDGMVNLNELMGEGKILERSSKDYVIFYDSEDGRYTLYNKDMTPILVSSEIPTMFRMNDGGYLVKAKTGGEYVCYVLK